MKKLFFLLVAAIATISCERAFTEEKTNSLQNEKNSITAKDTVQVNSESELDLEVDPGTIVPPRR